jgi:hypothetical protein
MRKKERKLEPTSLFHDHEFMFVHGLIADVKI